MLRLTDRVEIIEAGTGGYDSHGNLIIDWTNPTVVATLPAYVGTTATSLNTEAGRYELAEQLRCIIEPHPFDPVTQRIRWRDQQYLNDGPPMVRVRNGVDHHVTIAIKLVTG